MNQKRSEIEKFINKDLINAVEEALEKYRASEKRALASPSLAKKWVQAATLNNLGVSATEIAGTTIINPLINPLLGDFPAYGIETSEEYLQSNEIERKTWDSEFGDDETTFEQHKAEIFSHIYHFFSRYYDKGDFISLQRYSKQQKYAIPYNGEEVMLHWANKGQYFIKTGKNFQNYVFKDDGKTYTTHFRISNTPIEKNSNKDENRFFILKRKSKIETEDETEVLEPIFYYPENKELTILFEYRGLTKEEEKEFGTKNVQDKILDEIETKILAIIKDPDLKKVLTRPIDGKKNFLRKHLNRYVRENNTDYFIHKNLKRFLTNELDFYIKNEIFDLDNILESGNEAKMERYVGRVKVFKTICLKIIDFLSQIEEFQKKLFEKKKFVLTSEYCMTIDNVPEFIYPNILQNKAQLEEWEKLYGIRIKNQKSLYDLESQIIDLKANPYLVIDTKFFDQSFKDCLLSNFNDLDEATGGLMINSENWQALNLLLNKYTEQIKCIYIDPPYNTGKDKFPYKDRYMHSCWLSLLSQTIQSSKGILTLDGIFFCSIDSNEAHNLKQVFNEYFGSDNYLADLIWDLGTGTTAGHFTRSHEYIYSYAKNKKMLDNFDYTDGGTITHGALKKISKANPASEILFPAGIEFEGDKDEFSGCIGGSEKEYIISEKMEFENGKLKKPVIIKAGWAMKKQILNWLEGKETYDTKGQKVTKFYFNKNGILCYEKEKSKINPKTVISKLTNTKEGTSTLKNVINEDIDLYPKPPKLLEFLINLGSQDEASIILDFFAGSGTTAHAILNLNKEECGNRKYILIEMGDYFDSVLKPRIKKIIYSKDWKDERPQSKDGQSHIFKYLTLEQYEDTLNNIEFGEKSSFQRRLNGFSDYMLHYMLDFETAYSPCRLNITKLKNPFNYTLKVSDQNELREQVVDLVETFNYLLGIHVKKVKTFENNGTYYRVIYGFKVQGENERKENIIVVWRCTVGLDLKEDKNFIESTVLSEKEPDSKVYVNSDFAVEGAFPIEPTFSRLMGA
ncbi:site-specific DNA-methyltransferase [Methanosarcina mazei]|jgi:adenine-specific DNA-methyltransferase|nr:site-specific DNA-methyltransferase [Methanosarcina mazei]QCR16499.1 site-specific DNA-methyltransferase [Methanosarcina mazei]BBL63942.1 site-specific DNA-methyltransferase [Methanosarcina mazei]